MADFTVEGIVIVDVSRGIRDLSRFQKKLKETWADAKALDKELDKLDGRRVNVNLDAKKAEAQIKQFKADIKELDHARAVMKVEVEEAATELKLRKIADQMDVLDKKKSTPKVEVSGIDRDIARLKVLEKEINKLSRDSAKFGIKFDNTKLIAEAEGLKSELRAVFGRPIEQKVKIDEKGLSQFKKAAGGLIPTLGAPNMGGTLIGGIALLLTTLAPLTAVATGVAAGLVGAFSVMGVGVGAFAAFAIPTFKKIATNITAIDKATKGLKGAEKLAAMNKVLDQLDPAMRNAVKNFYKFKDAYMSMVKQLQPAVLKIFADALNLALTGLHKLFPIAKAAAPAIDALVNSMNRGLNGKEMGKFFDYVTKNIGWFIRTWGAAVGNFIVGIANMIRAFDPLSKFVSKGFLGMSEDFRKWSNGLSKNKGFQDFVAYVKKNGPLVGHLLGAMILGIINLGKAVAPTGEYIIKFVTHMLDLYNAWAQANPEANKFVGKMLAIAAVALPLLPIFSGLLKPLTAIGPLLGALGTMLGPIAPELAALLGPLGAIAGPLAIAAALFGGVAIALALCTDTGKPFHDMWAKIKGLWDTIVQTTRMVWKELQKVWQQLKDSGVLATLQGALGDLADDFGKLMKALQPLIPILGPIIIAGFILLAGAIKQLGWAIKGITLLVNAWVAIWTTAIRGIVAVFQWLYDTLIGHSIIPDLVNGIVRWFSSLPGKIGGALAGLVSSVAGWFSQMAGSAIAKVSSMVGSVVSWFGNMVGQAGARIGAFVGMIGARFSEARASALAKAESIRASVVQKMQDLISGIGRKLGQVKGIVTGAFAGAGGWLVGAGSRLMGGLLSGINAGISKIKGAISSALGWIKNHLPGSPIKMGPLKPWNSGAPGKKLMGLVAKGIEADTSVQSAMQNALGGVDVGGTMTRSWTNLDSAIASGGGGAAPGGGNGINAGVYVAPGGITVHSADPDAGRSVVKTLTRVKRVGQFGGGNTTSVKPNNRKKK